MRDAPRQYHHLDAKPRDRLVVRFRLGNNVPGRTPDIPQSNYRNAGVAVEREVFRMMSAQWPELERQP